MRRMEKQAIKTMAAIEGVGKATEGGASSKNIQALTQQERNLRNVDRAAKGTGNSLRNYERDSKNAARASENLGTKLRKLGGIFVGVRAIMMTLKFGAIAVAITALVQAVGALAGGLTALIPNLATAAQAFVAFPAAIAAAVQGMATMKLALGGVGSALQAGIDLQVHHAKTSVDMANQARQSAEAIRQANQGVITSQRDVTNATQSLTQAHWSQFDAQRQLTDARREAIRELQDLQTASTNAALSEARASLSLRQARYELSQRALDPSATALDMADAQLSVREAQANLRSSKTSQHRASQDLTRARRRGGAQGSDVMIQARRGIITAQQGIVSATQGVSDALFNQTSATMALVDAQRAANQAARQGTSTQNAFKQALKNLSPQAKTFVKYLVSMHSTFLKLRTAAGKQFFPLMQKGIQNLTKAMPMLQRVFQRTGAVLGGTFQMITKQLTTPARLKDLQTIGNSNNQMLARMGQALNNVIQGFTDLLIAARPLTNWLSKTIEQWTATWRINEAVGRATGTLSDKFAQVRDVLDQFFRIASNVWDVLKGLMTAAAPLGQRLWDGAEQATQGMADFLNSASGVQKVTDWFNALYAPLHALGQLTADLAKGWATLTINPSFTQTVDHLRAAVPYLVKLMGGVSGLGPTVADTLTQLLRLLANLPFNSLTLFLRIFNKLLEAVSGLIEKFPILGDVVSGALAVAFGAKALSLIGTFGSKLLGLAGIFGKVGKAAEEANLAGGVAGSAPWTITKGAGGTAAKDAEQSLASRLGRSAFVQGLGGTALGGALFKGGSKLGGAFNALKGRLFGSTAADTGMSIGFGSDLAANGASKAGLLARFGGFAGRTLGRAAPVVGVALLGQQVAQAIVGKDASMGQLTGISPEQLGNTQVGQQAAQALGTLQGQMKSLISSGDVSRLRDWQHEFAGLRRSAYEAAPQIGSNIDEIQTALKGAISEAKNTQAFGKLTNQLNGLSKISKTDSRHFADALSKMPPAARDAGYKALVAQAQSMEKYGYLPKGAAEKLMRQIGDQMQKKAKEGAKAGRSLIRSLTDGIEKAFPTLTKALGGIGKAMGVSSIGQVPGLSSLASIFETPAQKIGAIAGSKRATMALQTRSGITADGIFGPATLKAAGKELGLTAKQMQGVQKDLADNTIKTWQDTNQKVKQLSNDTQKSTTADTLTTKQLIDNYTSQLQTNQSDAWGRIKEIIGNNSLQAKKAAGQNFQQLHDEAVKALVQMGFSRGQAKNAISGKGKGPGGGGARKGARGLRIGGHGLHDTVPVAPGHLAAPGELIVNRHTEHRVNAMLGGRTTLGKEVAGESVPHHRGFAKGGRSPYSYPIGPGGVIGRTDMGVDISGAGTTIGAIGDARIISTSNLFSGSGFGGPGQGVVYQLLAGAPKGVGPDSNYVFVYEDFNPMVRGGQRVRGGQPIGHIAPGPFGIEMGFSNSSGVPLASGTYHEGQVTAQGTAMANLLASLGGGRGVQAVAGGGLGAGMGAAPHLKMPAGATGGFPAALANLATKRVHDALQQKINGMGGTTGGLAGSVPVGPIQQMAHKMVMREWGASQWGPFSSLEMQEAGWNPKALNASSGAAGLAQALPASKYPPGAWPYTGPKSAELQLQWMMGYIRSVYGSPAGAWAHEQANNWYRNGFEGRVSRPTIMGVGDGGPEDVSVRPAHTSVAGRTPKGGDITVNIAHIDYRAPGDIKKAVEDEFKKLGEDLNLVG